MPLIKPEVQDMMRRVGLAKELGDGSISEKFSEAGLSDDTIAEGYAELARSGNEHIRLKALDSASKIRGALKEVLPQAPSFTIILQSAPGVSTTPGVNPILFPRQSLNTDNYKEKENIN